MKWLAIPMLCVAFGLSGCDDDNGFENAGEKIDESVEEVGDEIEDAADEVEDELDDNDVIDD